MKRYLFFFLAIIIAFDVCWEIYYSHGGSFSTVLSHLETSEQKKANKLEDELSKTEQQYLLNSEYTICIDPGHGLTSKTGTESIYPGAKESANTYTQGQAGEDINEQALNLKYAIAIRDALEERKFNVIMTRETDECDLSESERAKSGADADFIMSVHCDGTEYGSPNGISLFYPEKSYGKNKSLPEQSLEIGQSVFNAVTTNTGAVRRITAPANDIILFNYSEVPVFKIVFGSIENKTDEQNLLSEKYMERFVIGVVNGFERYVNSRQSD